MQDIQLIKVRYSIDENITIKRVLCLFSPSDKSCAPVVKRLQTLGIQGILVSSVWFFSAVHFQMFPQITCLRGNIITLVAFVWLFSTVRFQMCPQITCPRWGKVTLVAFVWLSSTVRFQMCPQITCQRSGKVTLVTFVWLFCIVRFQMSPQTACLWG